MIDKYNKLNLFAIDGRIGRGVYFFFSFILPTLFFWIIAAIAGQIARLGNHGITVAYILTLMALLIAMVILLRLTVQRIHDFNKTGWLALLVVVFPPIILLYWLIPGNKEINSYGKPSLPLPKLLKWLTILLFSFLLVVTVYIVSQLERSMLTF